MKINGKGLKYKFRFWRKGCKVLRIVVLCLLYVAMFFLLLPFLIVGKITLTILK